MVKTTNTQLDTNKSYKYGCNNDGYEKFSYRCDLCGCKCHNKKQLDKHFDLCADRLVNALQFMLRDDTTHLTPLYFEQSQFDVNPMKLINKIHKKLIQPYLKKPELIHTSEPISYKKSEDLIPLNMPVNNTHTQPISPNKPNKPIKKKQVKQDIVKPIIV